MTLFILLSIAVAVGNVWLVVRLWYLVAQKRKVLEESRMHRDELKKELEQAKIYNRVLAKEVIESEDQ